MSFLSEINLKLRQNTMATVTARAHHYEQDQTRPYWEVRLWKQVLAAIVVVTIPFVLLMIVIGGIIFWLPHLPGVVHSRDISSTETAQNGLGTIKKMVGDNAAWSSAIKQEYQRLYGSSPGAVSCSNPDSDIVRAK